MRPKQWGFFPQVLLRNEINTQRPTITAVHLCKTILHNRFRTFYAAYLFLYLIRNLWFSDVFMGYRQTSRMKWVTENFIRGSITFYKVICSWKFGVIWTLRIWNLHLKWFCDGEMPFSLSTSQKQTKPTCKFWIFPANSKNKICYTKIMGIEPIDNYFAIHVEISQWTCTLNVYK